MAQMLKISIQNIIIIIGIFSIFSECRQEKYIFRPDVLPKDYKFTFDEKFQEYFIKVDKKTSLSGLLFKADSSKGLIFYLHGNAGALDSWGQISDVYTKNNYDFFILDYRGYGKSEGRISSEKQLYRDLQIVYDSMKTIYNEKNIIIIGYSIGTGLAAELASVNNPKMLILKTPYYNFPVLVHQFIKIAPSFIMKYKFRTNEFVQMSKCPIVMFHGTDDQTIYIESSYRLKKLLKPSDKLIILDGQKHNGINSNEVYKAELKKLLE
ncbi:MAG: hydrolase [Bacteroidetes bacterium GWA2_31_9]|nr:MAG: hydrolase [Bacteroidetes bacterium GWA2_31_9]